MLLISSTIVGTKLDFLLEGTLLKFYCLVITQELRDELWPLLFYDVRKDGGGGLCLSRDFGKLKLKKATA